MRLDKIIARSRIIDLRSLTLEAALAELLDTCIARFPDLKREAILKGLLARESSMTTYLGLGVALPHVHVKTLRRYILAIGRSRAGMRHQGAMSGESRAPDRDADRRGVGAGHAPGPGLHRAPRQGAGARRQLCERP